MNDKNKITCVMVGHRYVNEVQTVAQVFFPYEKFEFVFGTRGAGLVVAPLCKTKTIITGVTDTAVWARVYRDDVEIASCDISLAETKIIESGLSPRRVLMLVLFHALKGVVGVDTPWGALTGIRPSKMVRGWLDEGKCGGDTIGILTDVLCVREDKARLALTVAYAENRLTKRIFAVGNPPFIPGAHDTEPSVQQAPPPLGIYIGIPFCPSRCSYCSFNMGHKPPTRDLLTSYVDTLVRECREKEAEARSMGGVVTSLYIGGGTPTVLPDDLLARLLNAVGECFGTVFEYTVEAGRPDTLTAEKLRLLRNHNVNRIAVNPQTLNDETLVKIGRNHTVADFYRAFSLARDTGFDCINTDLIAGLPGEGFDDLYKSLEALLPLKPENITLHALSVKRASKMNEDRINEGNSAVTRTTGAGGDLLRGDSGGILTRAGYSPYYLYRQKNTIDLSENIGYSQPGYECLYNIGMMSEVQTILGIGAGAVSKYVSGMKISRVFNEKNPEIYIQRKGIT